MAGLRLDLTQGLGRMGIRGISISKMHLGIRITDMGLMEKFIVQMAMCMGRKVKHLVKRARHGVRMAKCIGLKDQVAGALSSRN